jgi:hypothetical protein
VEPPGKAGSFHHHVPTCLSRLHGFRYVSMPAMGGMPLGTDEGVLRNQRMYGATLLSMMRNSSGVRGSCRNAASAVSGEIPPTAPSDP